MQGADELWHGLPRWQWDLWGNSRVCRQAEGVQERISQGNQIKLAYIKEVDERGKEC